MMDGLERGSKVSCEQTLTKKYPKFWVTRTCLPLLIKTNDNLYEALTSFISLSSNHFSSSSSGNKIQQMVT
jgi:hypothetical protein